MGHSTRYEGRLDRWSSRGGGVIVAVIILAIAIVVVHHVLEASRTRAAVILLWDILEAFGTRADVILTLLLVSVAMWCVSDIFEDAAWVRVAALSVSLLSSLWILGFAIAHVAG